MDSQFTARTLLQWSHGALFFCSHLHLPKHLTHNHEVRIYSRSLLEMNMVIGKLERCCKLFAGWFHPF
ncbi:hypothetical protein ACHQM5_025920 [Ranunculus cassubicifolius]